MYFCFYRVTQNLQTYRFTIDSELWINSTRPTKCLYDIFVTHYNGVVSNVNG